MENSAPKKPQRSVLLSLYDYHSKLYHNVLVDISDEAAGNRLGTKANHVAWLAGSLVNERFTLAGMLGVNEKQTSVSFSKITKAFRMILLNPTYEAPFLSFFISAFPFLFSANMSSLSN